MAPRLARSYPQTRGHSEPGAPTSQPKRHTHSSRSMADLRPLGQPLPFPTRPLRDPRAPQEGTSPAHGHSPGPSSSHKQQKSPASGRPFPPLSLHNTNMRSRVHTHDHTGSPGRLPPTCRPGLLPSAHARPPAPSHLAHTDARTATPRPHAGPQARIARSRPARSPRSRSARLPGPPTPRPGRAASRGPGGRRRGGEGRRGGRGALRPILPEQLMLLPLPPGQSPPPPPPPGGWLDARLPGREKAKSRSTDV